jgi:hypothetical protein
MVSTTVLNPRMTFFLRFAVIVIIHKDILRTFFSHMKALSQVYVYCSLLGSRFFLILLFKKIEKISKNHHTVLVVFGYM